jgi:hypothetical protein
MGMWNINRYRINGSCLQKYLFTYVCFMYNYYVTIIFLPWILNTHKLCQNFRKLLFFNSFHKFILNSYNKMLSSSKDDSKGFKYSFIYKKKLNKKIHKVLHITWLFSCVRTFFLWVTILESCKLICIKNIFMSHHLWTIHFNLCKKFFFVSHHP